MMSLLPRERVLELQRSVAAGMATAGMIQDLLSDYKSRYEIVAMAQSPGNRSRLWSLSPAGRLRSEIERLERMLNSITEAGSEGPVEAERYRYAQLYAQLEGSAIEVVTGTSAMHGFRYRGIYHPAVEVLPEYTEHYNRELAAALPEQELKTYQQACRLRSRWYAKHWPSQHTFRDPEPGLSRPCANSLACR